MAYIEINSLNLKHNLSVIEKVSNKEIFAVVKDDAYGHGLLQVAPILREYGIKRVCVRSVEEAKKIENMFEEILVFFPDFNHNSDNISYAIGSFEQLQKNRHKQIHLKFDTGIHRNGIELSDFDKVMEFVVKNGFNLRGVFSHFCCADDDFDYTDKQLELFKNIRDRVKDICQKNGMEVPKFHIENSDALFKLNTDFDYVRPGIAIYGGLDNRELKAVMKLVGEKIDSRVLKSGEGIGYNKCFVADRDLKVTLVDLGYGDGILYFRDRIKLKDSEAIGKISMDSMSVVGEFDEVVIFDDVREFVKNYNTIVYDILLKLKSNIKRIVV